MSKHKIQDKSQFPILPILPNKSQFLPNVVTQGSYASGSRSYTAFMSHCIRDKSQNNNWDLVVFGFWILSFGFLCGCQSGSLYKDKRIAMGTFVEVISPDKRAADVVFSEIKRIEDLLSKYKENSEVSQLNKLGKLNASPETFHVLGRSKDFWLASNGAFDITVGPLIDLWGFSDKKYYLPKEEEIKQALNFVGSDKIIFNNQNNMIEFSVLGMEIDLGAIGKGYAVDCAVKKWRLSGIRSGLINVGGHIYCLGDKLGKTWKVGIRNPRAPGILDYIELRNQAVATSGDYEQYFIKNDKRYAHILNPKTGYPADSGVASVTVIAPDCLTADALATAVFVLGKEKGEALAKKFPGVEVKIIEDKL